MKSVDYIVVGLGLAGANFCIELEKRNRSFIVFDDKRTASSHKAAGLINPITGRNYAKSWNIDNLIPKALENYHWLEKRLGQNFISQLDIRRVLNDVNEENKWASRTLDPSYKDYLSMDSPHNLAHLGFAEEDRVIKVHGAYKLEAGQLTDAYKNQLIKEAKLSEDLFDFSKINFKEKRYLDFSYGELVICEGALSMGSPFDFLPIIKNLGEVLHVKLSPPEPNLAYKKKAFIVPHQGMYWVGGTYTNLKDNSEYIPQYDKLESWLIKAYQQPYEIVGRTFGIRPTVPDRKPLVGRHPELNHVHILNGLGTKGASLGPFAAESLCRYLEEGTTLLDEIDISRYSN